jgi:DNA modification methylase
MSRYQIIEGDSSEALKQFPDNHFHCIVTSPPYWQLRDYFCEGQLGMEATPNEYVSNLVAIMRESKRVLRKDGVMWMVMGDTYSTPKKGNTQDNVNSKLRRDKLHDQHIDKKTPKGMKKKNLIGIPWKVAFGLQDDGWILRCDIIWSKVNPMPDGAKDRPTRSHEYVFMFTKEEKYYYDHFAVMEKAKTKKKNTRKFGANNQKGTFRQDQDRFFTDNGKRNKRSVWTTPVASSGGKHFGVFPEKLIEPCILSSTSSYGCCSVCNSPWKMKYDKKQDEYDWIPTCKCGEKNSIVNCRVLDPFSGVSTTGVVCVKYDVDYVGIELNPEYVEAAQERLDMIDPIFGD